MCVYLSLYIYIYIYPHICVCYIYIYIYINKSSKAATQEGKATAEGDLTATIKDLADIFHMRNLLGWLRLGWLNIAYITLT